ncbi:MAG: hypothetical protein JXR37_37945 [Kiritimatiellae bacterium]|nr:hypothetical protein [Kiritimatiellia bacterium]
MNTEDAVVNIDTVEQFTLYCLDRSAEALAQLCEQSRTCGRALAEDRLAAGLAALKEVAEKLHDFDVFENEVCTLFGTERADLGDDRGSLQAGMDQFHSVQQQLLVSLEQNDRERLVRVLAEDLPAVLGRLCELLPVVRTEIDEKYVQTTR